MARLERQKTSGVVWSCRQEMPLLNDLNQKQEIDAAALSVLLKRLREVRKQEPFEHLLDKCRNQAELASLGCGEKRDEADVDPEVTPTSSEEGSGSPDARRSTMSLAISNSTYPRAGRHNRLLSRQIPPGRLGQYLDRGGRQEVRRPGC